MGTKTKLKQWKRFDASMPTALNPKLTRLAKFKAKKAANDALDDHSDWKRIFQDAADDIGEHLEG